MKENSTPFDVAEYDRQIKRTLPFYEEMFQQVVNIVRILNLQSLRWLDVGCGTGKMARTVLDNFDIQKMVCIDVEQEMLERAESLRDDEKVEFLQCDVRQLPYQEMFDIVTAIQVNHYFKKNDRIAAIKNCYDALAENGIYISFENFAPDIELQAFEEKVCCLVQNQMLVNIIDRALLRLKRYPDRGELYYEILTKQFIYRFNSTEKELLEELNIERSVFYDRKREAIYLFSVCLFGYSIPEVLEELPRLNSD